MNPIVDALERCAPILATLALIAGALWIGTLFAVSWLCGRARLMADTSEIVGLAVSLNRRWTIPCLVACVVCSFGWLCALPRSAFDGRWLYGLDGAIVALVLVHARVAQRARRVVRGNARALHGELARRTALVLSLATLAALMTFRSIAMH